jgi:hypothetical protein
VATEILNVGLVMLMHASIASCMILVVRDLVLYRWGGLSSSFVCYVLVFEEHCVANSCCPSFHNVDVETLVMLHCHPNVEAGVRVDVPGLSVLGFDVGHHCASQGCEGAFHVVVLPMNMGIHGHF